MIIKCESPHNWAEKEVILSRISRTKEKKKSTRKITENTQGLFRTFPGSYHIYGCPQSFQQQKVSRVSLLSETEVSQALLTAESNFEAPQTSQPDDALARFLKAFQGTKMSIKESYLD